MTSEPPHYQLRSVFADGSSSLPEIFPISELPTHAISSRRGFLGAGAALAVLTGSAGTAHDAQAAPFPGGSQVKAHQKFVADLEFSPDDSYLVSASHDRTAKIWDFSADVWAIEHDRAVRNVAINPDGQFIATCSNDRTIQIVSHSGDLVHELTGHDRSVNSVEFLSIDRLASASYDRTIRIWNVLAGNELQSLAAHEGAVHALARIPNSDYFVSASSDKTVGLWNAESGELIARLEGHEGSIVDIRAVPSGWGFVTRSTDKTLGIWNLQKRALVRRLTAPWDNLDAIAIGAGSDQLATAKNQKISTWTMPQGESIHTLEGHRSRVTCLAYSNDGNRLASGDSSGVILIWNLASGKLESALFDADANPTASEGVSFEIEIDGRVVTYSLPCGSPLPPNATCVCNCVPGTLRLTSAYVPRNRKPDKIADQPRIRRPRQRRVYPISPVRAFIHPATQPRTFVLPATRPIYKPRSGMRSRSSSSCSCNKVCSCIPVCQAHLLLHKSTTVRSMAEQLLLAMGKMELTYLKWATNSAGGLLRERLSDLMARIERGELPDKDRWPAAAECLSLLDDEHFVVSVMAAQFLSIYRDNPGLPSVSEAPRIKVDHILRQADAIAWFTQTEKHASEESR